MVYRVVEVAERLKVSRQTVIAMIADGRIKGAFRVDPNRNRSHWRIPEKSLLDTVNQNGNMHDSFDSHYDITPLPGDTLEERKRNLIALCRNFRANKRGKKAS